MASLRLRLARSLAGMQRPKLAAGRALNLAPVAIHSLPARRELTLHPDAPVRAPADAAPLPPAGFAPVKPLQAPPTSFQAAALATATTSALEFDDWPDAELATLPSDGAGRTDLLAPLLQPPYRPGEGELSALPDELKPYQLSALEALTASDAFLLAGEPGLNMTATAIVALADLVQRRTIRRALLISPGARHRHWRRRAQEWAPGLSWALLPAGGPPARRAWTQRAHVVLCDPHRFAQDLNRGFIRGGDSPFDLIAIDAGLSVVHRDPGLLEQLNRLQAPRRWVLTGALPDRLEDWRSLFAFLTPDHPLSGEESLEAVRGRLTGHYLRLRKASLRDQLPNRVRREFWLDLDEQQQRAYQEALAQELNTLRQLGESVARTHIESALGTLNRATAFAQGSLDGVKVRALTEMLEALAAAGDKVVLFSQYLHRSLEPLQQALHAYGAQLLSETAGDAEREQILATFRRDPRRRVLLAHLEARADGQPMPASHVVHFDVGWNSARRIRAEQRFYPELKPEVPLTITEFWTAGTHDERLHSLLAGRGLLPSDLPQGTRPSELEGRVTVKDWLESVFEATEELRREPRQPAQSAGSGLLPGTTVLRSELEGMSDDEMSDAVGALMQALGFPKSERVDDPEFEGLSLNASPGLGVEGDVLVRVHRGDKNVGVAEGRALLDAVDSEPEFVAGYLVATRDFTSACKNLAEESEGRLALVSGAEFFRHLRILGWI